MADDPNDPPLTPELLVWAYSQGMFPMAPDRDSDRVQWFCPDPRAVLPLDGLRCPRSLRQRVRAGVFEIRSDTAFEQVIRACAEPRPAQADSWINPRIVEAYCELYALGIAHSLEAWRDGQLAGGLYGVSLGGAFFGESMFHRPERGGTDASKVCLVHLVERLRRGGYTLLDVQMNSEHMQRFGTVEIPHAQYMRQLQRALSVDATW